MASSSGRFVIAFNGEIYNHLELRKALGEGVVWRGRSDTETLLACIALWGLEATLKKATGMFALALWDRHTRLLTLARDRLGEKPLYYGWQGGGNQRVFLFGSELKALKAHPLFSAGIDRGALCLLLRHNYIPAPYSIYQNIDKLEPGCLLSVSMAQPEPKLWRYWDATVLARAGAAMPFTGTATEAVDALEVLAKDAVSHQMLADVPVGAFLSGGVDSSTVVALMQAQSSRPVKTFTIGFHEKGYNEAEHAKAVATHLSTDHTELYVTPRQAMAIIPRLPDLYCEPFADSTQIPNLLLSQLAKQHVTVSLSGDAGDELFCGYDRYTLTQNQWRKLSFVPRPLRALAAKCITAVPPAAWDRFAQRAFGVDYVCMTGSRLHQRAGMLFTATADELYGKVVSHIDNPSDWVIDGMEPPTRLRDSSGNLSGLSALERMMVLDAISYLPDDILAKVDRAAMGVSLETRVPFLDHRLVEFAWRLPLDYKLHQGQSKWVLRELLYRHVPRELIERPKQGFSVPLGDWLRGPLREWAESLLDESRLRREGYFQPGPIRQIWAAHLSGKRDWMARLWNILMFQAWLEVQQA
jgi:asparagine synthase (glutamine-hydrolysing)